jgi:hypothetical protein
MVVVFLAFWSSQGAGFAWYLGGNGLELVSSSRLQGVDSPLDHGHCAQSFEPCDYRSEHRRPRRAAIVRRKLSSAAERRPSTDLDPD